MILVALHRTPGEEDGDVKAKPFGDLSGLDRARRDRGVSLPDAAGADLIPGTARTRVYIRKMVRLAQR